MTTHDTTEKRIDDVRRDVVPVAGVPLPTSSSGAIWIIAGGLISATTVAVLAPMVGLRLPGLATTGIVVVTTLYAVMFLVRLFVRPPRLRLQLLAIDLACICLAALVSLIFVTAAAWNILG